MEKQQRLWLAIGFIIIICAVVLRVATPRNRWVCENGEWRAQGQPTTAKPTKICNDDRSFDAEVKTLSALIEEQEAAVPLSISSSSSSSSATSTSQENSPSLNSTVVAHLNQPESVKAPVSVELISPQPKELLRSPYQVTGRALGSWFFEGSLPVVLKTASGQVLVETAAKAQGEWMTNGWVSFSANLVFEAGAATSGELIIKKDNPSGLPENEAQVSYPVLLAPK